MADSLGLRRTVSQRKAFPVRRQCSADVFIGSTVTRDNKAPPLSSTYFALLPAPAAFVHSHQETSSDNDNATTKFRWPWRLKDDDSTAPHLLHEINTADGKFFNSCSSSNSRSSSRSSACDTSFPTEWSKPTSASMQNDQGKILRTSTAARYFRHSAERVLPLGMNEVLLMQEQQK